MSKFSAKVTGDRRVKQLLSEMVDRTTGVQAAWPGVGDVVASAMADQFASEGVALTGRPWAPLKPAYLRWKRRNGFRPEILRQTDQMRGGLVSRPMAIEEYRPMSASFGTDDEKAEFHQGGTQFMAQREIINVNEDLADDINSVLARYIFEGRLA